MTSERDQLQHCLQLAALTLTEAMVQAEELRNQLSDALDVCHLLEERLTLAQNPAATPPPSKKQRNNRRIKPLRRNAGHLLERAKP